MSDKSLNWKFVEESVTEDHELETARVNSLEVGLAPISPSVGSQIAFITSAISAKSIVEIGTGCGLGTLWLLKGAPGASVTTVDDEAEYHALTREVLEKLPNQKVRMILGRFSEVLPRLNEAAYDLVLLHARKSIATDFEYALTLVRQGGVVLIANALNDSAVANPAKRDDMTKQLRSILEETAESQSVIASLIASGDGLLQIHVKSE
ncbi:MAG: class I SAM-dependent methyltransferase [Microbacteriaceae bacterium]|nr:class I SAM-dependent methyltransferase [Microbacteriaceae bacterium]